MILLLVAQTSKTVVGPLTKTSESPIYFHLPHLYFSLMLLVTHQLSETQVICWLRRSLLSSLVVVGCQFMVVWLNRAFVTFLNRAFADLLVVWLNRVCEREILFNLFLRVRLEPFFF